MICYVKLLFISLHDVTLRYAITALLCVEYYKESAFFILNITIFKVFQHLNNLNTKKVWVITPEAHPPPLDRNESQQSNQHNTYNISCFLCLYSKLKVMQESLFSMPLNS